MPGLVAGHLDRYITLQTAASVQSPSGEPTLDWDHAVEVQLWAAWLPGGTREAWQAQQRLGSYVEGVFQIYDRHPRPTPQNSRILWDDRVFDVKPYVEIGRGEGLLIPVVARGETS